MRFILAVILTLTIGAAMSLHDVDKTNSNRITPILNSADDVQQRMAQGTNGVQNTNDPEEVDGLQVRERQIVAVQGGENKAAFGFYGDANKFGLKVAEDGVDVLTATDDQLIFNSEQNVFKIVETITQNFTGITVAAGTSGSGTFFTIPHGQDRTPIIQAYIRASLLDSGLSLIASSYTQLPIYAAGTLGADFYWLPESGSSSYRVFTALVAVDDTNIYVSFITYGNGGGSPTTLQPVPFTAFVMQETAN